MGTIYKTHRELAEHLGIPEEPLYAVIAYKALERIKNLEVAAKALLKAEWMVTHDWGGDREEVIDTLANLLGEDEG